MSIKGDVNGFNRIGRLAFRRINELKESTIEIVALNDLTSPKVLDHLLKFDSTHGNLTQDVSFDDDGLIINDKKIKVYSEKEAQNIPWRGNDAVDIVLECIGLYTSK